MNDILDQQFESAVRRAAAVHASNIVSDSLPAFVRMARIDPSRLDSMVKKLVGLTSFGYGNTVPALYCLIKLADVNQEMKDMIRDMMGTALLEYLAGDEDDNVGGNARILKAILDGAKLADFEKQEETNAAPMSNTYNLQNSNLAINSPSARQKIENQLEYDEETKQLLLELTQALEKRDRSRILQILSFIGDKSVDVLIAVVTGVALQRS